LIRNRVVQTLPQLDEDLAQLRLPPPAHRLAQHREPSLPGLPAAMRETEEVEGLGFPVATVPPVPVRRAAEFDEACLLGMQRQSESRETVAQLDEKAFGLLAMLAAHDEVSRPGELHPRRSQNRT
jgi:hypothetical protein